MASQTPVPAKQNYVSLLRALVSILETVAFFVSLVFAAMNHGSDWHNAVITALSGLVMHGVNHNAGGSPV